MSSPHLHRPAQFSPSGWFIVAIPTTVVSLIVAAVAWAVSGNGWVGLGTWLAVEAGAAYLADRRGHVNLAALLGGAAVTMIALMAVPVAMAHYYIAQ
jgi:hypothetical protein